MALVPAGTALDPFKDQLHGSLVMELRLTWPNVFSNLLLMLCYNVVCISEEILRVFFLLSYVGC